MKRLINYAFAVSIFALVTITAAAQDERTKAEFFGGYSYLSTDTGIDEDFEFDDFDSRLGSHGFNASITGNVHKYAGIKFDFSTHSKSENFVDGSDTLNFKFRTNQFLGGVQVKDNRKNGKRVKPFGHFLAGVANQKLTASGSFVEPARAEGGIITTTFDESASFNNFAMVLGAGLDVMVSPRVDIRVFQIDFNPIFFRGRDDDEFTLPGRTQKNFRISVGVVIH